MLKMSNNLFIITAPSGAGKTTLIKRAIDYAKKIDEQVHLAVSHTTRNPRSGEENGKDYSFINEEEFKNNIAQDKYLEYALVHGNLYGTPKSEIENKLKDGIKVLLEIDWQGALQIMEHYPEATYEYHEGRKFDDGTVEVSVTITIGETSRMATLPVMDYKNKAIISPDARQINDNKQRCFVKAIAMFGLGISVFTGMATLEL